MLHYTPQTKGCCSTLLGLKTSVLPAQPSALIVCMPISHLRHGIRMAKALACLATWKKIGGGTSRPNGKQGKQPFFCPSEKNPCNHYCLENLPLIPSKWPMFLKGETRPTIQRSHGTSQWRPRISLFSTILHGNLRYPTPINKALLRDY